MGSQTCHVCGRRIKSNAPLPMIQHSKRHRREFREEFDREPEDYDEVKEELGTCSCSKCSEEKDSRPDSVTRAKDMIKRLEDY